MQHVLVLEPIGYMQRISLGTHWLCTAYLFGNLNRIIFLTAIYSVRLTVIVVVVVVESIYIAPL